MRFLVTILAVSAAIATTTEYRACHHDAERFCKRELSRGPFTIAQCLAAHKATLSFACRAILESNGL